MGLSGERKQLLTPMLVGIVCLLVGASTLISAERTIHFFGIYCDDYSGAGGAINEDVAIDKLLMDSLFDTNYSEASWKVKLSRIFVRGQDATKDNVLKEIAELESIVGPEDTVYVHFSGHGAIMDKKKSHDTTFD